MITHPSKSVESDMQALTFQNTSIRQVNDSLEDQSVSYNSIGILK